MDEFNAKDYRLDREEADMLNLGILDAEDTPDAEDYQDPDDKTYYPPQELYQSGIDYLESLGYHIKPDLGGQFAFHRIYSERNPRPIEGIQTHPGFRVLEPIMEPATIGQLEKRISEIPHKAVRDFWFPVVNPDPGFRAPLYCQARKLLAAEAARRQYNSGEPFNLGISLTEETGARAWIPCRESFAPQLHQVTLSDIFTLFPPAETEMLSLIIGRLVVGRDNNIHHGTEEAIRHTSRMAAIIVGENPGTGKSTIFRKLFDALKQTGYSQGTFSNINSRFNMAQVVTSDVIYKDDVVTKSLKSFLTSENSKIVVTGGEIRTEDKGVDAVNSPCHGVILLNTNEYNPRLSYDIDAGIADRMKLISTWRDSELDSLELTGVSEGSPNPRPFHHLPWLAKKLKVSEDALMLWAARLCADKFLEVIQDDSEPGVNQLERQVDRITPQLRYRFYKDATQQLMLAALGCHIMKHSSWTSSRNPNKIKLHPIDQVPWERLLSDLRFFAQAYQARTFRDYLKDKWEAEGSPSDHVWPGIDSIMVSTIPYALQCYNRSATMGGSLSENLKQLFGNLLLKDGFAVSSDIVWLSKSWDNVLAQATGYYKKLREYYFEFTELSKPGQPYEVTDDDFTDTFQANADIKLPPDLYEVHL